MGAAGSSTRAIHNHHPGSGRSNGSTNLKGRGSFSKDQTFYTPNPNNQFIQHYHQQLSNSYDRKHNLTSSNRSRGYSQNHSCTRSQQHLQIPSSFPATSTTKPLQYSTSSPSSGNPLTQHPQHHASSLSLQKTFGRRRSSNQTMESLSPSSHGSIFSTTPNSSIHHDHLPRHSEEHPDDLISGQEFRWLHGRRYHNTPSLYMLPNDTEEVDR
ncbi:hypothetical protein BGW38_009873 [Lunasporangiospora selenospora]|uniref:Uncharacterized protein n=1 Tax=Lunasporangiospora selenospora TaxID=979761 RepID=A0A9P6F231_9FUNG|nr:hypothetical protein BGW38_009873 [Lunasporangiospora selenospora]